MPPHRKKAPAKKTARNPKPETSVIPAEDRDVLDQVIAARQVPPAETAPAHQ